MNSIRLFFSITISLALSHVAVFSQNKNITFRSQLQFPGKSLSNIWGYKSPAGVEYALVGTSTGISIVDVSNPASPVLLHDIPGNNSDWREIRTQGNFAYVTTEGGGGITIINLSNLPAVPVFKQFTNAGSAGTINRVHSLQVADDKLYLHGSTLSNGGSLVFSLADPYNPVFLGSYSTRYVHDGFVKNNILYAGEINDGLFTIIDFNNPTAPVELASLTTPSSFTHNTWMSTDENTIFTTDEVSGSFVTAYDIRNLNNIKELGRYRHNNSGSIGHNTYVLNDSSATGFKKDFVITSYYTDGVTIVDATDPANMIEIGNYDTSPFSGSTFNGAWGVYPFLPSGNLLISDIEGGLFVLTPTYVPASRAEGIVTDSISGNTLSSVDVQILTTAISTKSNLVGKYSFGLAVSGLFDISFSKNGFETKILKNVSLNSGILSVNNVQLKPLQSFQFNGKVFGNNNPSVQGIKLTITNALVNESVSTNINNDFVFPIVFPGTYYLEISKWGFRPILDTIIITSSSKTENYLLNRGYFDDFNENLNWTVSSTGTSGEWIRDVPVGTTLGGAFANPNVDVSSDYGNICFITGNEGGGAGFDDVDNGGTRLTSPIFDLTDHINPVVNYGRWFVNGGGQSAPNDVMTIKISNGITSVDLEVIDNNTLGEANWIFQSYPLNGLIDLTSTMRLEVYIADDAPGHVLEGGFDQFDISFDALTSSVNEISNTNSIRFQLLENPSNEFIALKYSLEANPNENTRVKIYNSLGQLVEEMKIIDKEGIIKSSNNLPSGIYTVSLFSNSNFLTKKSILIK